MNTNGTCARISSLENGSLRHTLNWGLGGGVWGLGLWGLGFALPMGGDVHCLEAVQALHCCQQAHTLEVCG